MGGCVFVWCVLGVCVDLIVVGFCFINLLFDVIFFMFVYWEVKYMFYGV